MDESGTPARQPVPDGRVPDMDSGDATSAGQPPRIAATRRTIVLWHEGGHGLVIGMDPDPHGHRAAFQAKLKKVRHVCAGDYFFAVLFMNGLVESWCDQIGKMSDSDEREDGVTPDFVIQLFFVHDKLKDVTHIAATGHAFAAILENGDVVTWGCSRWGGDSSCVRHRLKGVQRVVALHSTFVAVLADGGVVHWPPRKSPIWNTPVSLGCVKDIRVGSESLAVLRTDGSVLTLGGTAYCTDSCAIPGCLREVRRICATYHAFAAILANERVVTWGHPRYGGDCSGVKDRLVNVKEIVGTGYAFAAVLGNGEVVTWGSDDSGGDSSKVQDRLRNVIQIAASLDAFAALLGDGSVVAWGDREVGGDRSIVPGQLEGVKHVVAASEFFVAILADGSLVTWR